MTEEFEYGTATIDELQRIVEIKMAMFQEIGLSGLFLTKGYVRFSSNK